MSNDSERNFRNLRIDLPENVRSILSALETAGYEAYAVGGCIRDRLLGRKPGDWDITTSARPAEIKQVFRRTVDTGIEHGTVTVLLGGGSYEVTTYRIDGEYEDGRHPKEVTFTASLEEDLKRRDFTINAMAYSERDGLVDLFGGREDLRRGIIRCVGRANDRFDEDALRILRAVRFSAQLDFDIDAEARDAISMHAPRLRDVSAERIMAELSRLICSAHIEKTADIFQLGIVPYIAKHFREINIAQLMGLKAAALKQAAYRAAGVGESGTTETRPESEAGGVATDRDTETSAEFAGGATDAKLSDGCSAETSEMAVNSTDSPDKESETMAATETSADTAFDLCAVTDTTHRYVRFALLTEGINPAHVDEMLKSLKADNLTRKNTVVLSERVLKPLPHEACALKRCMSDLSPALFADLLRLKLVSSRTMLYEKYCAEEDLGAVLERYNEIASNAEPIYISDLAVTGTDLRSAGVKEGPGLGQLLRAMQEHVWAHPADNGKDALMKQFVRSS